MAQSFVARHVQGFTGYDRRQGKDPAAQSFAENQNIRFNPEMFEGEHTASAAEADWDLIEDK
jgi:hypothetical protein